MCLPPVVVGLAPAAHGGVLAAVGYGAGGGLVVAEEIVASGVAGLAPPVVVERAVASRLVGAVASVDGACVHVLLPGEWA